jgi:hypothetical protein
MKTIFSGNITITTSKEDGEYTATAEWNGKGITSSKTNREYASIGELFGELKKLAIKEGEK